VLFGQRTLTSSTTLNEVPSAIIFTQNISDDASIFNLDAQAGLSYWFNPNLKNHGELSVRRLFQCAQNIQRKRQSRRRQSILPGTDVTADIEILIT